MRGTEGIVFAFRPLCESGQSVTLSQRADTVTPAGQDFMRIDLVADIPDDLVIRCIKQVMQRDRQFDHAKTGAEMATCDRNGINGLRTQFISDLLKIFGFEFLQIGGCLDLIEKRRLRRH